MLRHLLMALLVIFTAGCAAPAGEPLLAEDPAPVTPRLAILMYHEVDNSSSGPYTISIAHLEAHIQMLKAEGYAFYSLADVERLLRGEAGLSPRGVMLTFDDGYESFYTRVAPIAQTYSVPVVNFVITKYLDQVITTARPHMTPEQTRELAARPFTDLGGHSYDAHHMGKAADGSEKPVLANRVQNGQTGQVESEAEYTDRVRADFRRTAELLKAHGVKETARHYAFPFTARSEEAVRLGQQAGFVYFYVGGERLVDPHTDPTNLGRVHAGAPEITAETLRDHLRDLFAKP